MSALVLIGLVLVAAGLLVLVAQVVPRRRRREAGGEDPPRTVADLLRSRSTSDQDAGAPAAPPTGSGEDPAAPPAAPAATSAVPPGPVRTPTPETSAAGRTAQPSTGPATAPTAGAVSDVPVAPPGGGPFPTVARVQDLDLNTDDTPWRRAAIMAAGGRITVGTWHAPAAVEPVPLRLVPPAGGDGSVGWASWAAVDAEVEAEGRAGAVAGDPAPGTGRPESSAVLPGDGGKAPTPPAPTTSVAPDATREPVTDQRADAAPEQAPAPAPVPPPEDGTAPAADLAITPAPDPVPPAEPPRSAGPVGSAAGPPEPAGPPPSAVVAPLPERADRTAADPAPRSTGPVATMEPVPARGSLGRRTPAERAAEQAAADVALLRTFGFADPSQRPDVAPVVSMVRPDDPATSAAPNGSAQPVRFRAVRRDGASVGSVAVTLLDDRGREVAAVEADTDGRGEVPAPASGAYVLVSTAPGHQPGAVAITVSGEPAEVEVLLARSASVSGVVNGEDGPIGRARVTLVQDGEIVDAVDTDDAGGYRIGDIGAGEYGLTVAAAGCEPIAILVEVGEEADLRRDLDLRPASPMADDDSDDLDPTGFDLEGFDPDGYGPDDDLVNRHR